MSFIINFQNLTDLFWITIITLNLYVVVLLYRVAKQYRLERVIKLKATEHLRQHIELRKQQYFPQSSNSTAEPVTNSNDTKTATTKRVKQQLSNKPSNPEPIISYENKPYRLHKLKPSSVNPATRHNYQEIDGVFPSRSDSSNSTTVSIDQGDADQYHTLYISDSKGRMVHQIPFRECDYSEALNRTIPDWNRSTKRRTKS